MKNRRVQSLKKRKTKSKYLLRRRRVLILKLVSLVIGLGAMGYGVSYITHADFLTVNSINIEGNKLVANDEIKTLAEGGIAGAYLGLFPKANIFLVPRDKIEEAIQGSNTIFEKVKVQTDGLKGLQIAITERAPHALWCDGTVPQIRSKKSDCFYMDTNGLIFAGAPTYSGNALMKYGGEVGDSPLGKTFLQKKDLELLEAFTKNLSILNMSPDVLYVNQSEYELVLSNGSRLLFNTTFEPLALFTNLQSIIEEQGNAEKRKEFLSTLDYIDLRFGNKVFFKRK